MRIYFFSTCLLFTSLSFADKSVVVPEVEVPPHKVVQAPWFTGPLFASSGTTIPAGHYNIEPYLYAIGNTGVYTADWGVKSQKNYWNNLFQTAIQIGMNRWLDCQISPTYTFNYCDGASAWKWGDMPVQIDIQLYRNSVQKVTDWFSAVKLILKETIPIGKYQNLNPNKHKADIGGQGSWLSTVGLAWENLFYLNNHHFLSARFNAFYTVGTPISVKNLNYYGGGAGTRGKIYPGDIFQIDIGLELSLTRNWVFATDVLGIWEKKTKFKGITVVADGFAPSVQFSLAPAIEYNWSENLGIIFGPWFTIAGRNNYQFISAVFALNYYN